MAKDPKKPYGSVEYADPGTQEDGVYRYPIDTEEHARSALSYFSMPKNRAKYSAEDAKRIMGRIKAACRKFGIDVSDDDEDSGDQHRSATTPMIETRAATVGNVDFGQRIISLIAVPYEQSTEIMYRSEVWREMFTRTAFDGIETRSKRIPANREHNPEHLVGRVVHLDPHHGEGLAVDIRVSRTDRGDETLELAHDEVLSASAGFMVKDPYRDQVLDRRAKMRRINRAFLDHVAFVGVPAYTGARILSMRGDNVGNDSGLPPFATTPHIDQFLDDPFIQRALNRE